jgi:xylulokinase
MAWLARTDPALWEATDALLLPKDLVVRALTGEAASDPLSNIGLVGPDGAYVNDLLALVPGAAGRLPPLRPPTAVAGEARLRPGLRPVPVAVGAMDAFAGFLGAGLARDGDAVWLSGTSEVLAQAATAGPGAPGLLTFPSFGALRVHAGPTQAGGAAVAWLCGALGLAPEALEAAVAASGPAPLFLPHLGGERAPLWDPGARGAFLGLEAGMGAGALGRGVYEGVALSARLVLDGLDAATGGRADVLLCAGGGFRSDLWAQVRADVTGRTLHRARHLDAGVVGAAALGAVAAGLAADLAEALAGLVSVERTFEPDPSQRAPPRRPLRPLPPGLRGAAPRQPRAGRPTPWRFGDARLRSSPKRGRRSCGHFWAPWRSWRLGPRRRSA